MTHELVTSIHEDRSGVLWVGTLGSGLGFYDRAKDKFVFQTNDPKNLRSLGSNNVNAICEDRSGALWFGTGEVGLDRYDRARKVFAHYTQVPGDPKSLSYKVVNAIYEDRSGVVWVATNGGLNRFDRNTETFMHYNNDPTNPSSISHNTIHSVIEDSKGMLWVGTFGGGLEEFDRLRGRFIHYKHDPRNPKSLRINFIWPLLEDRSGALWIGGVGGLDKLNRGDETFTHYKHDPSNPRSLSPGMVTAVYEDESGMLWVGTTMGGLNKFDPATGNFTHYISDPRKQNSLNNNNVSSIYQDKLGTLWIGTLSGLDRFDPLTESFTSINDNDGLLNNAILGILEDDSGCLWLNNGRGLVKFNPRTGALRSYDPSDGVNIGQSFGYAYRNRRGELLFGGTNGFICFHPDSIRDNPYIPPIVITAFKKFDKLVPLDTSISEKKHLKLSYEDNVFSFEFAALNYVSPEKNQYAYELEGFDKDWIYCGTRRYASYTNLDGGTYVFRVKGSNNDGVWNEQGASITLIITPPFWKTWWFITMVWVSIAGAGAGTVRYVEITKLRRRMRALEQQQALEKERVRISIDLHDELASNLTSIAMLSKILYDEEQRGEATLKRRPQLLERITTLSKESVHGIRDIIWAIDPKAETLASLLQRIRDMAVVACRDRNVGFTYEASGVGQLRAADLTPVERRHLWLLLKEAVNNALNHSGCKQIALVTSLQGETVSITLNDDGCGFDSSVVSGGKGLKTMRLRAQEIGSGLDIVTRPGGGTSVTIFVKGQNRLN